MREISAAVCRAYDAPLTVETVRLAPPKDEEVQVEIEAVAICHSDIAFAKGAWGGHLPAVYGHEAVGRVSAAGPGAGFDVGATVLVTLIRACGRCAACLSGRPIACTAEVDDTAHPLSMPDGSAVKQAMHSGAFAEAVTVHRSQCVEVPADMPRAAAALISCGVITGVGAAVNSARIRPGEDVVVVGAGGVGLNAIQGARLCGARRIGAVDLSEAKLEDARAFGATDTAPATGKPWRVLREAMGRAPDVVMVATGAPAAYDTAFRFAGADGRVVAVGMPASDVTSAYSPIGVAYQCQHLIGSRMGEVVLARDVPWMVDLWRQGRLELEALVSRTWPLAQINEAIADTLAGTARRNVIVF